MAKSTQKVPVSKRAVVARVRRRLAKDGEFLKACRPDSRWHGDLGDWYTFDGRNLITGTNLDLETVARELEVLLPFERLVED